MLARYAADGVNSILSWEERKPQREAAFLEQAEAMGLRCTAIDLRTCHREGELFATIDNLYAPTSGERHFLVYEFQAAGERELAGDMEEQEAAV